MSTQSSDPAAQRLFLVHAAPARLDSRRRAQQVTLSREGGALLIVSLIILLLLTLIGVTAMSVTGLEEKMAGNLRDRNLAFQAAESALRAGEARLIPLVVPLNVVSPCAPATPPTCTWAFNAPGDFLTLDAAWWAANANAEPALAGVRTAPRFVIEDRDFIRDGASVGFGGSSGNKGVQVYRVTGRGTGGTDAAQVLVQDAFGKRFN